MIPCEYCGGASQPSATCQNCAAPLPRYNKPLIFINDEVDLTGWTPEPASVVRVLGCDPNVPLSHIVFYGLAIK